MVFIIISMIACDNDGLTSTESALLNYNPEQVVFNPVSSGDSDERDASDEWWVRKYENEW